MQYFRQSGVPYETLNKGHVHSVKCIFLYFIICRRQYTNKSLRYVVAPSTYSGSDAQLKVHPAGFRCADVRDSACIVPGVAYSASSGSDGQLKVYPTGFRCADVRASICYVPVVKPSHYEFNVTNKLRTAASPRVTSPHSPIKVKCS